MGRIDRNARFMAASALRAGADAAVTIAARTPGLMMHALSPTPAGARETHRMIQEKFDAVYEGATAAQIAWASLRDKAAFGGIRSPSDLSLGMSGVAAAAMRPARRKVRANAKRLSGWPRIG
jgi:hypothetical protein